MIPRCLVVVTLIAAAAPGQGPPPPDRSDADRKLIAEVNRTQAEAMQFVRQAKWPEAIARTERWVQLLRDLYPESRYPAGHADIAAGLGNLGFVLALAGKPDQAAARFEEATAVYRRLYPEAKFPAGHPEFATALSNMGGVMHHVGELHRAVPYYEQAVAMNRKLYPPDRHPAGHPTLAQSLDQLGVALQPLGAAEKALRAHEEALAINRKLYPPATFPDGHTDLAKSLGFTGGALLLAGQLDKAIPLFDQALAMNRRLYPAAKFPQGHPDLAADLNKMGYALKSARLYDRAVPFYAENLAINRKLYPAATHPDGHPDLALSLNALGGVLHAAGQDDRARPLLDEALAMARKVYPPGHSFLIKILQNLGTVHLAAGDAAAARPFFEEALAIRTQEVRQRVLLLGSEADALGAAVTQPVIRDLYLSAAAIAPGRESAYRAVWDTKATVSRVLELRHAAGRAAGTAAAAPLARLNEVRRATERLLAARPGPGRERDLARLADERDALERRLAADLPVLRAWTERDRLTPATLAAALPGGTVFIDFLAWDRTVAGARPGGRVVPTYGAFVVAHDRPVAWVDLGDAATIDRAVGDWRVAIERGGAGGAADPLRRLVWEPLARALPPGTKALYLSPDGDLARLPWAALPTGDRRVLLEDFAVAQVPHGPALLAALRAPPRPAGPDVPLVVGDVAYRTAAWPDLPGTRVETAAVAALAPAAPLTLARADATAARVAELIPRARFAHFATHGQFQSREFAAARRRELDAYRQWQEGGQPLARAVAGNNPLAFVGLVLADGEVMTGLSILNLNLDGLRLVTLSACETGLGEYTGGEGVQGLQRAFHLAGCPNVVASLWKVDDAATAALMAKFYHELWVAKKPPIEALREAQLTIYRHPELIPDLAGERGAPKLKAAVATTGGASGTPQAATRADTRLWAAFVLSGTGR